jgi:hypothetical protein
VYRLTRPSATHKLRESRLTLRVNRNGVDCLEAADEFFIVNIDEAETTAPAIFHDNAHGVFAQHYGYSHEVNRK